MRRCVAVVSIIISIIAAAAAAGMDPAVSRQQS